MRIGKRVMVFIRDDSKLGKIKSGKIIAKTKFSSEYIILCDDGNRVRTGECDIFPHFSKDKKDWENESV